MKRTISYVGEFWGKDFSKLLGELEADTQRIVLGLNQNYSMTKKINTSKCS